MKRILCLTAIVMLMACKGGKPGDERAFGSLNASFSSKGAGQGSDDAVVEGQETVVIQTDVDGDAIDTMGKSGDATGSGKGAPSTPVQSSGKDTPVAGTGKDTPAAGNGKDTTPPAPAKTPELPEAIKAKLAKCYPQWDKGATGSSYEIRQVSIDVDKLKKSSIQLTGDKPEVVFIDIKSETRIEKVSLSLENDKGLYCIDITAEKSIKSLDIGYVRGAKLGVIDIEGGKAKKVNIFEIQP